MNSKEIVLGLMQAQTHYGICEKPRSALFRAKSRVELHDGLVDKLKSLVYCIENNTDNEPSISCLHRAIDEAKVEIEKANNIK